MRRLPIFLIQAAPQAEASCPIILDYYPGPMKRSTNDAVLLASAGVQQKVVESVAGISLQATRRNGFLPIHRKAETIGISTHGCALACYLQCR